MKEQILKLREEGKTYNEIKEILGCSKGTISYHCGEGQKEKTNSRTKRQRNNKPLLKKLSEFKSKGNTNKTRDFQRNRNEGGTLADGRDFFFNEEDVLKKIECNPICYLTGRDIDIFKPSSYHFDHIIPIAKGGSNKLKNLGIACKDANFAKRDLLLEDFLVLCKDILEHNNYEVNKK